MTDRPLSEATQYKDDLVQQSSKPSFDGVPFSRIFFLFNVAVAMEELLHMPLCHTPWTNQMGYIKVKAQLPGIYGNVNRPRTKVGLLPGNWALTITYNHTTSSCLFTLSLVQISLVPRPFEERIKGLVHTVCACVIFSAEAGNLYFCPFITP